MFEMGRKLAVRPTKENGRTKRNAVSHSIAVASKQRVQQPPPSRFISEQLAEIRRQIGECIALR